MVIRCDGNGYPMKEDVEALQAWAGPVGDVPKVLQAVADYLNLNRYGQGKATLTDGTWRFVTGGWSGCEEVIDAIPPIVHALAWQESHRGGLHVYRLPIHRLPRGGK